MKEEESVDLVDEEFGVIKFLAILSIMDDTKVKRHNLRTN